MPEDECIVTRGVGKQRMVLDLCKMLLEYWNAIWRAMAGKHT